VWAAGRAGPSDFIGRATVRCTELYRDKWRRSVAVCRAKRKDLSAWMAAQGRAVAATEYSWDYVGQEAEAKGAHRGIWGGTSRCPGCGGHASHSGGGSSGRPADG
jgi:endonuclease YncB( thermonuclease family)